MKKPSASFTLIEVMLAVAVFAFAAVGFAVALNDVLGINVEIMRSSKRRQVVESVAARILATSNNLQEGEWHTEKNYSVWKLQSSCRRTKPVVIAGTNRAADRNLDGWYQVGVRAVGKNDETLDSVSFLLWGPQR
jgi:prepilin-type N-terminal cleavage/methylation domain-containing protein